MTTRNKSRREVLERLDRALNLVDEIEGMYAGWRPRESGSERKHNNGFSVQTPFDQDYEVANRQNRGDAERAERLGNDMYEGKGDFNGDAAVDAWEEEQDEGESPHTRHKGRRMDDEDEDEDEEAKAFDDEDEDEEEAKAFDDDEDEDEDEEEDDRKARRHKARDEDEDEDEPDEDEDEERKGRRVRKGRDTLKARRHKAQDEPTDEQEEEFEKDTHEEPGEEKARKARHRQKCRCMKCLIHKADAWEKSLEKARRDRAASKGRTVRKSLTMADMFEVSNKSLRTMEALSKALPAVVSAVKQVYAANDELADEMYELREDLSAFMAAPSRKSRVKTAERPRREAPVRDLSQDMAVLSKALESLNPDSPEAQKLVEDMAQIELGYPDRLSPYARSVLKQAR